MSGFVPLNASLYSSFRAQNKAERLSPVDLGIISRGVTDHCILHEGIHIP